MVSFASSPSFRNKIEGESVTGKSFAGTLNVACKGCLIVAPPWTLVIITQNVSSTSGSYIDKCKILHLKQKILSFHKL